MKKIDLSAVQSGVRKLGAVKATLEHFQESYIEAIANLVKGLIAGATVPVAIHGVVNSGSGSTYNISAGAIWHSGEVFEIDAFAGVAGGGQVPVLSLTTTYRTGDPVKYSDGSTHNTHSIRKYTWSFGASGSGLADFSAVVTLKNKVLTDLLAVPTTYAPIASPTFTGVPAAPTAAPGTNTTQLASTAFVTAAINALIGAAPGALNTLDELAAALSDDANFAASVTTALAGKVPTSRTITAGAGLSGGGDMSANRSFDVNVDDVGIEIASDALRLKDGGVTGAKIGAGAVNSSKVNSTVAISALIDSVSDVDSITQTGIYGISASATNAPTGNAFLLIAHHTVGVRYQMAIEVSTGDIYVRTWNLIGSAWNAWSLVNT